MFANEPCRRGYSERLVNKKSKDVTFILTYFISLINQGTKML